jgi:hypothetical protein
MHRSIAVPTHARIPVNPKAYTKLLEQVRALAPEAILAAARPCDGHSIFAPRLFLELGLPPDVVAYVTRTHSSDGSPKGTVYVHGQAVEQLDGVYGLDLLRLLASALGVTYPQKLGRGSQAREIQLALRCHFQQAAGPQAS